MNWAAIGLALLLCAAAVLRVGAALRPDAVPAVSCSACHDGT